MGGLIADTLFAIHELRISVIQDPITKEWLWRGKWYDHYPRKEIEEYNARYDEYMERKFDEMRDEGRA